MLAIECGGIEKEGVNQFYQVYTLENNTQTQLMNLMYPTQLKKLTTLIRVLCPYVEEQFKKTIPLVQIIKMENPSEVGIVGYAYPDLETKLIVIGINKKYIYNLKQSTSKHKFSESMKTFIEIFIHEFWHLYDHKGIEELSEEEMTEIRIDYNIELGKEGVSNNVIKD